MKNKFELKYFLGSQFKYNGIVIEIVAIDCEDEEGKYYQAEELGWVSDKILNELESIKLT